MSRPQVLISAHRFGVGDDRSARARPAENSLAALEDAIALGVDLVEFDVRRRRDGSFVVAHDADQMAGAPAYADVLAAISGRVGAHIDLKLTAKDRPYDAEAAAEIEAVRMAVERLEPGPHPLVVTLGNVEAARAIRTWADGSSDGSSNGRGPELLVGLSLGRWTEVFPWSRLRRSRADLVVAHWALARCGVALGCRLRGLPLLVWTVDSERGLRHWTRPGRCLIVTSNRPARALAARDRHAVRG